MKITELRIGNYVKTTFSKQRGKPIQINGIKSNFSGDYYSEVSSVKLEVWGDIKRLKPIPLTKEWLLKFGFSCHDECDEVGIIDSYYYITHKDRIFLRSLWGSEDYNLVVLEETGTEVEHVHTLQNLYHALTGEELKLKL